MKIVLSISVITGLIWGLLASSKILLNDPAGLNLGITNLQALSAGSFTGGLVGILSYPAYKFLSGWQLVWLTPVSLYLAIAIFISVLSLLFYPMSGIEQIVQVTLGAWWGLTMFFPLWVLFLFSFLNHSLLKYLTKKVEPVE